MIRPANACVTTPIPGYFDRGKRLGAVMRVSSKGRYAVVALLDVALNSMSRPVSLADVAARQKISLSYLEQLFALLRRAGLVTASRGPGGGYRLQRPASEISAADVFQTVEDSSATPAEGGARDWSAGPAAGLWKALDDHVEQFLGRITLAELMKDGLGPPLSFAGQSGPAGLSGEGKLA